LQIRRLADCAVQARRVAIERRHVLLLVRLVRGRDVARTDGAFVVALLLSLSLTYSGKAPPVFLPPVLAEPCVA
jgi:hypothetical protein